MVDTQTRFGFPIREDEQGRMLIGIPSTLDKGKTNWLRYYEMPAPDDYKGLLKLLESFELRFISHVSRGDTIKPTRRFLENALSLLPSHDSKDPVSGDRGEDVANLLRQEAMPGIVQSDLVVAYQKKGVEKIREYIDLRSRQAPGDVETEKMKKIAGEVEYCLMEAMKHAGKSGCNMRREDGSTDKDGALHEMLTEPFHIMTAVRAKTDAPNDNSLFLKNRYLKVSKAWDNIDKAGEALKTLVAHDPVLREVVIPLKNNQVKLSDVINLLPEAAKHRSHIMRSDPDYYAAEGDPFLRAVRNVLVDTTREFKISAENGVPSFSFVEKLSRQSEQYDAAYSLMREGVELIYDMSKIRLGRPKSVESYVEHVQQHVNKWQSLPAVVSL